MARGSINHISLTVSDLERSTAFYNKVFAFIGFTRVEVPESTQQAMKTRLKAWVGPGYSISIRPSKGEILLANSPSYFQVNFSGKIFRLFVVLNNWTAGSNESFLGWPTVSGEFAHRLHNRNAPGFNHLAFTAEDRSDVEKMYELLKEMGATVLDAPAEYPYSPGYFAVYFTDPDGLKFEFAYAPRP